MSAAGTLELFAPSVRVPAFSPVKMRKGVIDPEVAFFLTLPAAAIRAPSACARWPLLSSAEMGAGRTWRAESGAESRAESGGTENPEPGDRGCGNGKNLMQKLMHVKTPGPTIAMGMP